MVANLEDGFSRFKAHVKLSLKRKMISNFLLAVNSMHIKFNASKIAFSLVTDTICMFTVAKQGFLDNFGTGISFQKV